MEQKKIQKIKIELENLLAETKRKATEEGIDTNSPDFNDKLMEIRSKILKKFKITEEMLQRSTQEEVVDNINTKEEIKGILEEENIKNSVELIQAIRQAFKDFQKENIITKIEIGKIKKNIEAIVPFTQESIKGLGMSQTDHGDKHHPFIMATLNEIVGKVGDLSRMMEDQQKSVPESIEKRFGDLKIPILHKELKGIGPDDHHSEKHTIESHSDSPLMDKIKWVTSPGFIESFQGFINGAMPRMIDIAGITQNDADARYIIGDGVRKCTVGLTAPSSPAVGDLWVDTN